jgi:hypothetical protein
MQTPRILWETPEFTTAAMAVGQSVSTSLNHRFATVVTSSSFPTGTLTARTFEAISE